MTQGMPGSHLELESLAARLRRHGDDVALYGGFLLTVLSSALPPEMVRVRHESRWRARLAGRQPAILAASVIIDGQRYEVERAALGARPVTRIRHESGGVVLSTRQIDVEEWARALAAALVGVAARDAAAATALQRLTAP